MRFGGAKARGRQQKKFCDRSGEDNGQQAFCDKAN
jgi:hypothetical protein